MPGPNPDDIRRFLHEDLGDAGDITSNSVLGATKIIAHLVAREGCTLAGVAEANAVFTHLKCNVRQLRKDGETIKAGEKVLEIEGPARGVLAGERLALNFLMKMSGIATMAAELSRILKKSGASAKIAATRKTTPGFRAYEKKAVILGGGMPHRMGLYDWILIKDNHIMVAGSVQEALRRARLRHKNEPVEIEAQTQKQAVEAAQAGADIIMLDNFTPAGAAGAARKIRAISNKIKIEISGGITEKNVAKYAKSADIISVGALTHSPRAVNFSMDIDAVLK